LEPNELKVRDLTRTLNDRTERFQQYRAEWENISTLKLDHKKEVDELNQQLESGKMEFEKLSSENEERKTTILQLNPSKRRLVDLIWELLRDVSRDIPSPPLNANQHTLDAFRDNLVDKIFAHRAPLLPYDHYKYDRIAENFTFSMADPGSRTDHISLTRDVILVKLGVPCVETILTTIDRIMRRGTQYFDISDALPTLLETMGSQRLPSRTIRGYCLACCRILELYFRRRVQDTGETPYTSLLRIEHFVQSAKPIPKVLEVYITWLHRLVKGNPPTLVEMFGTLIKEHVQDVQMEHRRLHAFDSEFFLSQGDHNMAYFERGDITWSMLENHDYEVKFHQVRDYGNGMIGVPPPFHVALVDGCWIDKYLT
jgi:hypothetical protein